jgi:hypothetical protein
MYYCQWCDVKADGDCERKPGRVELVVTFKGENGRIRSDRVIGGEYPGCAPWPEYCGKGMQLGLLRWIRVAFMSRETSNRVVSRGLSVAVTSIFPYRALSVIASRAGCSAWP